MMPRASARPPQTAGKGIDRTRHLREKLIEHRQYIDNHGQDLGEIRNWKGVLTHE